MFGKLFALPARIVNVPMRAIEELLEVPEEDRILSKPLESIAKALEEAVDGESE